MLCHSAICYTHRGQLAGTGGKSKRGGRGVSRVSSGFDGVRSLCERWHKLHSLERLLTGQERVSLLLPLLSSLFSPLYLSLSFSPCFSFLSDYCYAAGSWTSSTVNGLTL